jgi:putative DNA primase/helicase
MPQAAAPAGEQGDRAPSQPGRLPDTHFDVVNRFLAVANRFWRYGHETGRWLTERDGLWAHSEHVTALIMQICDSMSDEILISDVPQAAQRSRSLRSGGTVMMVEKLLRGHPALAVREQDFDANPFWLNTPAGVVDLRDGSMFPAEPEMLMRRQTAIAPATTLRGASDEVYAASMTKFWRVIHNHINGRPGYYEALRAELANALVGHVDWQGIFFMVGEPGNGKTLVVSIVKEIAGSYAMMLSETLLSKNGDSGAKWFERANFPGLRMGFRDEVQEGMTFDETAMCEMATGKRLFTDVKHGRGIEYINNIKLFIVGNHYPHFVSPETGGLVSRVHVFKSEGRVFRNTAECDYALDKTILAEEGSVILQWLVDECIQLQQDPTRWARVTRPLREAAEEYAEEVSLISQWIKCEALRGWIVNPKAQCWTAEASNRYRQFAKDNDRRPKSIPEFKRALQQRFKGIIHYELWSKRDDYHNLSFIRGLGPKEGPSLTGDVVPFPDPAMQPRPTPPKSR